MQRGLSGFLRFAALLGLAAMCLVSCATQSGSTLRAVTAVESGDGSAETKPARVPESSKARKGLEIVSSPAGLMCSSTTPTRAKPPS